MNNIVTISSDFHIPIPTEIRQALALQSGQQLQMTYLNQRIELKPIPPIVKARGFLKGIDTRIEREPDRL